MIMVFLLILRQNTRERIESFSLSRLSMITILLSLMVSFRVTTLNESTLWASAGLSIVEISINAINIFFLITYI